MMDIVERVARAICQADEQNGAAPWDWYGSDKARSGYFDSARAAIEAMRECSGDMISAGAIAGDLPDRAAKEVWTDMIDAALKGEA